MNSESNGECFLDQFRPTTNHIAFYKCRLDDVRNACEDWLHSQCPFVVADTQLPVDAALSQLRPLTSLKDLFIKCQNGWVAHFVDRNDRPKCWPIASRIGCRFVTATYIPNTINESMDRGSLGSVQIELVEAGAENYYEETRAVAVINEGKRWIFYQSDSSPWPFEQVQRYQAKRKQDRFTLPMLNEYLGALGIRWRSPEFYLPFTILFEPLRDSDGYWGNKLPS